MVIDAQESLTAFRLEFIRNASALHAVMDLAEELNSGLNALVTDFLANCSDREALEEAGRIIRASTRHAHQHTEFHALH